MFKRFNWEEIVVHDETQIRGFFGEFRFLSNMYPCIMDDGNLALENSYMASRVIPEQRIVFNFLGAPEAKKILRADLKRKRTKRFTYVDKTPEEWDARKESVMEELLFQKFSRKLNPKLVDKLLATGDRYLEEKNYWSDSFWGVDYKLGGKNVLGKLLMKVRAEFL